MRYWHTPEYWQGWHRGVADGEAGKDYDHEWDKTPSRGSWDHGYQDGYRHGAQG